MRKSECTEHVPVIVHRTGGRKSAKLLNACGKCGAQIERDDEEDDWRAIPDEEPEAPRFPDEAPRG